MQIRAFLLPALPVRNCLSPTMVTSAGQWHRYAVRVTSFCAKGATNQPKGPDDVYPALFHFSR